MVRIIFTEKKVQELVKISLDTYRLLSARKGLQRPPGGDVKCGTGAKIVCEEAAFGQQGRPGSSGPAGQPWRPTEAPARLVCLTER